MIAFIIFILTETIILNRLKFQYNILSANVENKFWNWWWWWWWLCWWTSEWSMYSRFFFVVAYLLIDFIFQRIIVVILRFLWLPSEKQKTKKNKLETLSLRIFFLFCEMDRLHVCKRNVVCWQYLVADIRDPCGHHHHHQQSIKKKCEIVRMRIIKSSIKWMNNDKKKNEMLFIMEKRLKLLFFFYFTYSFFMHYSIICEKDKTKFLSIHIFQFFFLIFVSSQCWIFKLLNSWIICCCCFFFIVCMLITFIVV